MEFYAKIVWFYWYLLGFAFITGALVAFLRNLPAKFGADQALTKSMLDYLLIYFSADVKKEIPASHLVQEREQFSCSVMVSVAVLKVGQTSIPVSCSWSQVLKWTATTTALMCSENVCCLQISLPSTVATGGLCSKMAHRRTWPGTCGVRMSPLSNRTCGHPAARTYTRWIMPLQGCKCTCTM